MPYETQQIWDSLPGCQNYRIIIILLTYLLTFKYLILDEVGLVDECLSIARLVASI